MTVLRLICCMIASMLIAVSPINTWAKAEKHTSVKKVHRTRVTAPPGPSYAQRSDAMQAAESIAQAQQLDPTWVRGALAQARYVAAIAKAATPPPEGVAKNWAAYRARFIKPKRIQAGVAFWQVHRTALERAEQETSVPAAIVVGIIGVETLYGQHMGNYRVLDALATLAFDFPTTHPRAAERSAYFQGELGQFLALMQQQETDPTTVRGSYAGAMGLPQFMPTSWAKYAVDFDGDGKIDLHGSATDAIGSVANYFKAFGWQPGLATHFDVALEPERAKLDVLLAPDILPAFSVERFQANGALLRGAALQHSGLLALVELQNGNEPPSYVAGTENFYVITRYNWSSYYAMAVIELGQAVTAALTQTPD